MLSPTRGPQKISARDAPFPFPSGPFPSRSFPVVAGHFLLEFFPFRSTPSPWCPLPFTSEFSADRQKGVPRQPACSPPWSPYPMFVSIHHRHQGRRDMRCPWRPQAKKADLMSPEPLSCCSINSWMPCIITKQNMLCFNGHATDMPLCPIFNLERAGQCIYRSILTKKLYDLMQK